MKRYARGQIRPPLKQPTPNRSGGLVQQVAREEKDAVALDDLPCEAVDAQLIQGVLSAHLRKGRGANEADEFAPHRGRRLPVPRPFLLHPLFFDIVGFVRIALQSTRRRRKPSAVRYHEGPLDIQQANNSLKVHDF